MMVTYSAEFNTHTVVVEPSVPRVLHPKPPPAHGLSSSLTVTLRSIQIELNSNMCFRKVSISGKTEKESKEVKQRVA